MRWRFLKKGELDHELLWLCVSLATALMAAAWLHFQLQTPACAFHSITGWPCPTCGCTRVLRHLVAGQWSAALQINPLATVGAALFLFFDLYAAIVTLARLPRLRWDSIPPRTATRLRLLTAALFTLNWAWLIQKGV